MPCLLLILGLVFPRVVLVLVAIFNWPYLERAYTTFLWPLLGFFLLPLTTLAYAWAVNAHGGVNNAMTFIAMIIAVLIDVSGWEGGRRRRRR